MNYTIPQPDQINQSVADLMAKLYGNAPTPTTAVAPTMSMAPTVAPGSMSVAPGSMSVAPKTTVPTPTTGPTGAPGLGTASMNTGLQGRAYYENLVAVGTPQEKIAGQTWLRNNPVVPASTGTTGAQIKTATGGGTKTGGTQTGGTQTGGTPTIDPKTGAVVILPTPTPEDPRLTPTETTVQDPATIYANQLKNVQGEIDAANALYNDMLVQSRAQLAPIQKARTDQGFIGNVRSGTIGSGFDTGVNNGINTVNQNETTAAEAVINEKRAAAIAAIQGQARADASKELEYQREQKTKSADAYVQSLKEKPQRAADAVTRYVKAALASGLDITKATPEEIKKAADAFGSLGVAPGDIIAEYKKQMAEKATQDNATAQSTANLAKTKAETDKLNAEIKAGKWITIGDGSRIYNPETGQTIENPKTFSPNAGTSNPTPESVKVTVNQAIAAAKQDGSWNAGSDEQKAAFIQSLGGTPSDYGY